MLFYFIGWVKSDDDIKKKKPVKCIVLYLTFLDRADPLFVDPYHAMDERHLHHLLPSPVLKWTQAQTPAKKKLLLIKFYGAFFFCFVFDIFFFSIRMLNHHNNSRMLLPLYTLNRSKPTIAKNGTQHTHKTR